MEGQNILYGNIEALDHVRGLVEAREKVWTGIDSLNLEKQRLEKDVLADEKQLAENIENTVRKRREQVVSNFDKEINKSQDRLKKVRADRGKAKDRKVAKRIKEETADLVIENKNIHEEIRTYFKQKGVPGFLDNSFLYALYFPRSTREIMILVIAVLVGVIALPSVVVIYAGVRGFLKVLLTLLMIILFAFLYMFGYNYVRVRHGDVYTDMLVKRSAIRKNKSKINRIKRSIKKDKDEEQYGLHEYDEDIKEIEDAIEDIVRKKNDALADFEQTTKADICDEITNRDKPKIDDIKKRISEISIKLKELEQNQKDMSINLSTNYGAYLGEENMTIERITLLSQLINEGQATNIGEAVNLSKSISKK